MVNYNYSTKLQYSVLIGISIVTVALSLWGSVNVIFLILRSGAHRRRYDHTTPSRHNHSQHQYNRIMLGLSLSDILVTVAFALQPFSMPQFTNLPLARGGWTTCKAVGFLLQPLGSLLYATFLCLYFLFTIRYNYSETRIERYMDPYVHIIAWGVPLFIAIFQLLTGGVNPDPVLQGCLTAVYPADCTVNPDIECDRGGQDGVIVSAIHGGLIFLGTIVGVVSTWLTYSTLRNQTQRNMQYSTEALQQADVYDRQRRRLHQVAWQSIWYSAAFANILGSSILGMSMRMIYGDRLVMLKENEKYDHLSLYILLLVLYATTSIQGFLNWIIYIRPRMSSLMAAHKQRGFVWCYTRILLNDEQVAAAQQITEGAVGSRTTADDAAVAGDVRMDIEGMK